MYILERNYGKDGSFNQHQILMVLAYHKLDNNREDKMHEEARYKLVLANGAFKSGSTWLRDIAKRLVNFEKLADKFARERLKHNATY